MGNFTHLRTHTSYSLKDGLLSEDEIIDLAIKNNQSAVAITDLGKMFNTISFYEKARAKGVKAIIGVDAYIETDITNPNGYNEPTRLLLLCKNDKGYKNLLSLVSRANTENIKQEIPFIKQSWLKENTEGIIALSGDSLSGELALDCITESEVPYKDRVRNAIPKVNQYKEFFPDGFFLEIQRADRPTDDIFVRSMASLSYATKTPLVATHPVQFEKREDFYAHEVRTCLNQNTYVDDVKRETKFTRDQYFKSTEEMEELFKDIPQALTNSAVIASKCSVEIEVGNPYLPDFPTPNGEKIEDFLIQEAKKGLNEKLLKFFPDEKERNEKRKEYEDRLNYELKIINEMGFAGYFMIVSDFIKFAKDSDIPVGPGRGSGAGSLVALALDIIEIDPIKYNLLFERFLNPERKSMPDIDVDFDTERKNEVIDYVRKKYDSLTDSQAVALISTFNMSRPKSAVKDVAKIIQAIHTDNFKLSDYVKAYEATLSNEQKTKYTLEDVYNNTPELQRECAESDSLRKLFQISSKLIGVPKSLSKHPGGVVIAKGGLTNFSPLVMSNEDGKSVVVSQFDKDQVERSGLVKFDFLSVRNLDLIHATEIMINQREEFKNKKFNIKDIPMDDALVYQSFAEGNTIGIFQFESPGMRKTLKNIKADNINDLFAAVALFRPGPMDHIPEYARRKEGAPYEYIVPEMESILKETYGIMIYQEQVMQTAQKLAGYTLGQADNLRKAMGKKKPEEMAKQRDIFISGCLKNGISEDKSIEVFNTMEKFASYGFNKSHSVAYAILAYRNAYLKTYYPEEYYTALLNTDKSKINIFVQDMMKNDFSIVNPDINKSKIDFSPNGRKSIIFGLAGLKDVTAESVKAIINAREEKGEFTSFFDFFKKVDRGSLSEKVVQRLIQAGAFDSIDDRRDVLIANIGNGLKYAGKLAREKKEKGYILHELFGARGIHKDAKKLIVNSNDAIVEPELVIPEDKDRWTEIKAIEEEKEAIGLCLSKNMFSIYQKKLGGLEAATSLGDVNSKQHYQTFLFAGIVTKKDALITKKDKKPIAFITLDDGFFSQKIVMFDSVYKDNIDKFQEGQFVAIEGQVKPPKKNDEDTSNIVSVNQAFTFDELRSKLVTGIHLALKQEKLDGLIEILRKNQGESSVKIYLPNNENKYTCATLNENFNINLTPECINELESYLGANKVKLGFKKEMEFPKPLFARKPYNKPYNNNKPKDEQRPRMKP